MRWSSQSIDGEEQRSLPGYRDPASVRRFDAPEALDTRFYEVRAKSALNRVPDRSRMPFRWTVNPYRGCTHACTYCLSGDTAVLMADGTTKALAEIEIGDRIYGTRREGAYRRFTTTAVSAHWKSSRRAYRILAQDGTELVASGEHRFLTTRGWKHVIGSETGPLQRPHLTVNSELLGLGCFARATCASADYQRGYLCGVIRGDGTLGIYHHPRRRGRGGSTVHRFRLALADGEGLDRAQRYLAAAGVRTDRFDFSPATERHRKLEAIRTSAGASVESIRRLIEWPMRPSADWQRGFLAGIFDADGSAPPRGVIRIPNTGRSILRATSDAMTSLGFETALEDHRLPNGLATLRIRGGVTETLRFFHLCNPAISRKRSIEGRALKTGAKLKIEQIEPFRDHPVELYDITTGTGDFIANGVVSHNCFARPTHTYLDFDAARDFEREIVVKVNAPEVLRAELKRPSWKREHVALGTNTDPYQWAEGRYKLTRGILEALGDARNPCSILTKSPLLLRDLDVMKEIQAVASFGACLSIPTLEEKAWRETEPRTPNPRARLEAVAQLNAAGIPTGVLIAPLMPGINDSEEQVDELLAAAREAGATSIGGVALHLRGEVREVFKGWLADARPELVQRYEALYRRGAYAPLQERRRLARMVRKGELPSGFRFSDEESGEPMRQVAHATREHGEAQQTLF